MFARSPLLPLVLWGSPPLSCSVSPDAINFTNGRTISSIIAAAIRGSGGAGGGDTGTACGSSQSCPDGEICSTELGDCQQAPGCKDPNVGCPTVCFGVCQPKAGEACGKVTCGAGQVCCNASCGICTAPNEGCVALACTDDPPPPAVDCTTDADCHLAADYCGGCDCRALGSKVGLPACQAAPVACFAYPCMQKTAVCVPNGQCSVAAAPTR